MVIPHSMNASIESIELDSQLCYTRLVENSHNTVLRRQVYLDLVLASISNHAADDVCTLKICQLGNSAKIFIFICIVKIVVFTEEVQRARLAYPSIAQHF